MLSFAEQLTSLSEMTTEEKKRIYDKSPRDLLLMWMCERELIRKQKQADHPKPWTQDPWLQRYRFCNVFRDLDKVTIHYIDWISALTREKHVDYALVIFNTMLYRVFNRPETMDHLGIIREWDEGWFMGRVQELIDRRQKIFGSAYMITNAASCLPKHELLAQSMTKVWPNITGIANRTMQNLTLQHAANEIQRYYMFGPFVAYEIVTDLSYSILSIATDINTWANLGPGALRGVNRLEHRDLKTRVSPDDAVEYMLGLREWLNTRWPGPRTLSLRDTEHSLCEFDKYCRVMLGEGRPKSRYNGVR